MENYMLANFSTFIQLLDALFISMCFEGIFNFWNPRFKEKYELLANEVRDDEKKRNVLLNLGITTNNFVMEYKHSIFKRGAIMTVFTTALLFFTGLETYVPFKEGDPVYLSLGVSSVVLFCFLAVCLNKIILLKKHRLLPQRKFNLIVIGYFLVPITFISIYLWGDAIREFIDMYKNTIITVLLFLFALHMIFFHDKFKVEDVKPVTRFEKLTPYLMNIYHHFGSIFFTILPIIYSNEIFNICREHAVYVTLGVCVFEILWQLFLSYHYGSVYPRYLERVLIDAHVLVHFYKDKLSDEELNSKFMSTLKTKLSRDPTFSKFYLINLDMMENHYRWFVSKVKYEIEWRRRLKELRKKLRDLQ